MLSWSLNYSDALIWSHVRDSISARLRADAVLHAPEAQTQTSITSTSPHSSSLLSTFPSASTTTMATRIDRSKKPYSVRGRSGESAAPAPTAHFAFTAPRGPP